MTQQNSTGVPNIFPCLRYQDAPAAIEWLVKAFGFERHAVYEGPDGTIGHAELRLGPGFIMLGSSKDDVFQMKSPRELGGVNCSICIAITEVDSHCERARACGAEIIQGPEDTDYGARGYSARDPEGNLWHFSTYSPDPSHASTDAT